MKSLSKAALHARLRVERDVKNLLRLVATSLRLYIGLFRFDLSLVPKQRYSCKLVSFICQKPILQAAVLIPDDLQCSASSLKSCRLDRLPLPRSLSLHWELTKVHRRYLPH